MFAIRKEELGRVDMIHVVGRADGFNAPQLDEALQQSIKDKRYRIVVDLSESEFITSAALRALLKARQAYTSEGGTGTYASLASPRD